jgi:hypothetical protein
MPGFWTRSEEEYVNIPLNIYQALLNELEQSRKALDEYNKASMSTSNLPERKIAIGHDPATFRLEAWSERAHKHSRTES